MDPHRGAPHLRRWRVGGPAAASFRPYDRAVTPDVPAIRVVVRNDAPVRPDAAFVLYWMTAARRPRASFALQRAVRWAEELGRPLVVLEALRVDYPHASERLHAFAIDGMHANAEHFARRAVTYVPYVEPTPGAGKGLLEALAAHAAVVVGDDAPTFFLPRMIAAAAPRLGVRFETVDGVGILPLRAAPDSFPLAIAFRRFLQKNLRPHLRASPLDDPLEGLALPRLAALPPAIAERWRPAALHDARALLASLPIDHTVAPVEERGGHDAAHARLDAFVRRRLARYAEERSHPDEDVASGLSMHLHWGHLGAHEVLSAVARATDWSPDRVSEKASGRREGWWNASPSADAFLDQIVTWRELGHVRCNTSSDWDRYEGVPGWARASLEKHARDPRPVILSVEELERGGTADAVWNAAMRQLREEGRIQNYARMLWGKRVLTWTAHPKDAFDALVHLNDRWAVDGRDPNSYSGIGWCFGAYDRPWPPDKPIFGIVRIMTSASALRKLRMREWMARWGEPRIGNLFE